MSSLIKRFFETLIISLIVTLIINKLLPETFSLNFFSVSLEIIPRFVYILVIITAIFWWTLPKRKSWKELNKVGFHFLSPKPKYITKIYEILAFGVRWKVLKGNDSIIKFPEENIYFYAEGPFCPYCNYELDSKIVPLFLGYSSRSCWYCEDCNKMFKRPKKQLFNEKESVIKKVKKQITPSQ